LHSAAIPALLPTTLLLLLPPEPLRLDPALLAAAAACTAVAGALDTLSSVIAKARRLRAKHRHDRHEYSRWSTRWQSPGDLPIPG